MHPLLDSHLSPISLQPIQKLQSKGITDHKKTLTKKGRGMDWEDSRKIGKGDTEAESLRAIEKEEIPSTEFPEDGNTIYTKRTPQHPNVGNNHKKKRKKSIDNLI